MATATETRTAPAVKQDTTTSEFLALIAGQETPEYAPGRINSGRQASFDAVAGWSASGAID